MTQELSCINPNMYNKDINNSDQVPNSDHITPSDSDSDNEIQFKAKSKKQRVTESDSDTDKENDTKKVNLVSSPLKSNSDNSDDGRIFSNRKNSRIKSVANDSESLSENDNIGETSKYDLTRTKIKNKELHDKFKKLKHSKTTPKENSHQDSSEASDGKDTDHSSDGAVSCSKIKQKLKKKTSHNLASICDPDTSEEETNVDVKIQKSKPRSTKLISPKPVRMSAKQAMENMQKIKSESNRMLREKEVSLPYHRPKALTLKDIMNRRRPAYTSDGKSLPIKMNNEQLKQYALMLEQRQKEMMELCKSDTDEEEQDCPEEQVPINKSKEDKESSGNEMTLNQENNVSSDVNDKVYDDITMEHSMNVSKSLNEQNLEEEMVVGETIEEVCQIAADKNHECQENADHKSGSIIKDQVRQKGLPIVNENTLPVNNSNKDTIVITDKDEQTLEVCTFSENSELKLNDTNKSTEQESQIISLHYDSERIETTDIENKLKCSEQIQTSSFQEKLGVPVMTNSELNNKITDEFSDDDFTMEELDEVIANAEVNKDSSNKNFLNIKSTLEMKPTLEGSPGMVIDLDDNGENTQKKLTGVELLKERFTYFARLKSLEDMEKDREKKFKPGIQHLKLKQELEEQIAEQRSLEWEKRLQVENQLKAEINAVEGEEYDGEDIEKIEAKLEENDVMDEEEESSSEEEIEDTDALKDKPRIRNPLIDDEAEVSEEEDLDKVSDVKCNEEVTGNGDDDNEDGDDENDSESDDEDSSQSEEEEEQQTTRKKGRILKAFEDSDDEDLINHSRDEVLQSKSHEIRESQDEEIQLAQPQKTYSDDLFTSQECSQKSLNKTDEAKVADTSMDDLGSQTFSILKSAADNIADTKDVSSEKLDVIYETQPCTNDNFDAIVGMCTGGFSQNLVTPQAEPSQLSQSQEIDDNMIELCTGTYDDNPMESQNDDKVENIMEDESNIQKPDDIHTTEKKPVEIIMTEKKSEEINMTEKESTEITMTRKLEIAEPTKLKGENKLLKSILEELNDPEFDSPKANKYFFNATKSQDKGNTASESTQFKKKFVIESDDEINEDAECTTKKKRKKRRLENRALQISDDEEDEYSEQEEESNVSDIEEDNDRLVEYDSEENEVEIQAKVPKKKRGGGDFFEQEAELTSEDEWIGSGDEDEGGLDRMEREEGDDDTFHQGKLQRELGEIHMREVLDQDKREVRLLQELLFEDGDLGDGHRQRKFRWKNADGDEELGTNVDEYADTQEDEFESEEQWRKQRHEREMFLRNLNEKDEDENISINRSAFIKAKLASKSISGANSENNSRMENIKSHETTEKKMVNSIPSPKKPFIILQQNYHNSLLTRGRGALARLAALATPLAGDGDDVPKVNTLSNRGNFVFAAITPTDPGSKVTKRKADTAPDTPRLLKKMKQEANTSSKSSLLDHL